MGIGSESKNASGVSIAWLSEFELVPKTVWIVSSELMFGELDEKVENWC